jgi:excisionase family DNA binding protein
MLAWVVSRSGGMDAQGMTLYRLITPLLDIDEVARLLRVKRSTLYKWVCYNKIPYLKIRRRLLFNREQIERWIEKQNMGRGG